MITEPCAICSLEKRFRRADHMHHLIPGNGRRKAFDSIKIPLCAEHHEKIHKDPDITWLSKMLGQAIVERNIISEGSDTDKARMIFIDKNGKNYLWD